MELIIIGLLLWSAVHLLPSLGLPLKQAVVAKLGEKPYLLMFTVLIISSLVLIVMGWRQTIPSYWYVLPPASRHIGMLLVLLAFLLFGASQYPTRIRRFVRHPQLTAVIIWATAHLLMNGDSRSVVLFGGLGLWAIMAMIFINRRDGVWVKPEIGSSWGVEVLGAFVSVAVMVAVMFAHPYIAGIPLF